MEGFLWDWVPRGLPVVSVAIGTGVVTMAFFQLLHSLTGSTPPESRLWFTPKDLSEFLRPDLQERSILYRRTLQFDYVFALVYSAALVWVLDGTLGVALKDPGNWRGLIVVPLAAGLFDVLENTLLLLVVPRSPMSSWAPSKIRVLLAASFSALKWGAVCATIVLIAMGSIALGIGGAGVWNPLPLVSPTAWTLVVLALGVELSLMIALEGFSAASWERQKLGGAVHASGAVVVFIVAITLGFSLSQLGFRSLSQPCGGWCGSLGVAILVALVVAAAAAPAGKHTVDKRFELWGGRLVTKILLLIPATVAFEELAFRGLLFRLWEDSFQPSTAVAATAIAFGLWHIIPALERIAANPRGEAGTGQRRSAVLGTVLFTAAAGVGFGLLRHWSGCLWAPMLAHWGANSIGVVAIAFGAKRKRRIAKRGSLPID